MGKKISKEKLEQLKKRNDRLLQKQRTFDEMKRLVEDKQPAETPEEMAMRVKMMRG